MAGVKIRFPDGEPPRTRPASRAPNTIERGAADEGSGLASGRVSGQVSGRTQDAKTPPADFARARAAADRLKGLQRASSLELVLQVERQVRTASSLRDLAFLAANETRKLTNARQIIVLAYAGRTWRVEAISSIAQVDRNAPFVQFVEGLAGDLSHSGRSAFSLLEVAGEAVDLVVEYPFPHGLFTVMRGQDGTVKGALIQLGEAAFSETAQTISDRLAESFGHQIDFLSRRPSVWTLLRAWRQSRSRWLAAGCLVALAGLLAIPVPLTALAPVEVVARAPQIVAAPIAGVVDRIAVSPNSVVKKGDLLVQLEDTEVRNALAVAEQRVSVAKARFQRSSQAAFADPNARRELTVARAEYDLAQTERDYAKELLAQTRIIASADGVAVYGDANDWRGRPVAVGEQILQIADPQHVQLRIDLPVADAILLRPDRPLRVFLDADPLSAFDGRITHVSYRAMPNATRQLVYRVRGTLDERAGGADGVVRIGSRGTAQVYGEDVSLGFYLFRRPFAALRQMIGL